MTLLLVLPGQVDGQDLLARLLAAEDTAERAAGLGAAGLVALGELVGVEHGVGHHGVGGQLGALPPQLQAHLGGYGCSAQRHTHTHTHIKRTPNVEDNAGDSETCAHTMEEADRG